MAEERTSHLNEALDRLREENRELQKRIRALENGTELERLRDTNRKLNRRAQALAGADARAARATRSRDAMLEMLERQLKSVQDKYHVVERQLWALRFSFSRGARVLFDAGVPVEEFLVSDGDLVDVEKLFDHLAKNYKRPL